MSTKKVIAVVEASSTGYGVYSDSLPGITGYGKTVDKAKTNFYSALEETIKSYKKVKLPKELKGKFSIIFKYDIASIFEHFGMLDATGLAEKIGMNASLLRQYKSGHALASDKQKAKIQNGLHALGRELLQIRL